MDYRGRVQSVYGVQHGVLVVAPHTRALRALVVEPLHDIDGPVAAVLDEMVLSVAAKDTQLAADIGVHAAGVLVVYPVVRRVDGKIWVIVRRSAMVEPVVGIRPVLDVIFVKIGAHADVALGKDVA